VYLSKKGPPTALRLTVNCPILLLFLPIGRNLKDIVNEPFIGSVPEIRDFRVVPLLSTAK
jgi:hypothetical protein